MLCVEDYLDTLKWAAKLGGLPALIGRADANLAALDDWVQKTAWVDFLCTDPKIRSNTSVCLKIVDPWFVALDDAGKAEAAKKLAMMLETEGVGFDVAGYRAAPPGLRIWCGATVETDDIENLTPWLDWAYAQVKHG